MKRIKENITDKQFKVLMTHLHGDTSIRNNRKQRLTTIFNLLYYTGLRVNETTQFTDTMLSELINNKTLIVETHKTKTERVLYITDNGQKYLRKVFDDLHKTDSKLVQSERCTRELNTNSVTRDVNSYLKVVFGKDTRITTHSFRQTLITQLSECGVNTKVIQTLIGHKSVNSTLRYIKPSVETVVNSLNGVR